MYSRDRRHRYLLWRTLDAGHGTLLVVGLNPSTADENQNDPTITRCIGFARAWGYRKLLVANLFAFCATRPVDLKQAADPVGAENNKWLVDATNIAWDTLVAWGNTGNWQGRGQQVLPLLKRAACLGLTKQGAPRHPLYVRRDQVMVEFDS